MPRTTIALDPKRQVGIGGLTGTISWERLEPLLLSPSEMVRGDKIVEVTISEHGLQFVIEKSTG